MNEQNVFFNKKEDRMKKGNVGNQKDLQQMSPKWGNLVVKQMRGNQEASNKLRSLRLYQS